MNAYCFACDKQRAFSRRWWAIRIEDHGMLKASYWVCGRHPEATLPDGSVHKRPECIMPRKGDKCA